MKHKYMLLIMAVFIVSCAYGTQPIKTIMSDPHYARYQTKLDDLEKLYLDGDISYPDYVQRKDMVEGEYTREVKERESIIHEN